MQIAHDVCDDVITGQCYWFWNSKTYL